MMLRSSISRRSLLAGSAAALAMPARAANVGTRRALLRRNTSGLPAGLLGLWYMDQYQSATAAIPNAAGGGAVSGNLIRAPRRLFANTDYWTRQDVTATDSVATAPDGSGDASSIAGTAGQNWLISPKSTRTLPAGTYTVATDAKRNDVTNQQFSLYTANTVNRGSPLTATSSWQRLSRTFTLGSPAAINTIGIGSIDGTTAAKLLICNFELFAGAADLGPETYSGNLYLGDSFYDTRPAYSGGVVDFSTGGFGLAQMAAATTISSSGITAMALVAKVDDGSRRNGGYQAFVSDTIQDNFTAFFGVSGVPQDFTTAAFSSNDKAALWNLQGQGYHVLAHRYDGTNRDMWLDDVLAMRKVSSVSNFSAADWWVNVLSSVGNYAVAKLGALAVWNRALSDAELRSAARTLQAYGTAHTLSMPAMRFYFAEGDSITDGQNSLTHYPWVYAASASPTVIGANLAVPGSGNTTLVSRAAVLDARIPPSPAGRKFILSVLIGANDLGSGGVTSWLNIVAGYCDARRAAGWKVVLCTITPKSSAGFNTDRGVANTEMRLWTTGGSTVPGIHADAICDFAADPTMGPDAAGSDVSLYSDGTHPTQLGQNNLAAIIQPVINGI